MIEDELLVSFFHHPWRTENEKEALFFIVIDLSASLLSRLSLDAQFLAPSLRVSFLNQTLRFRDQNLQYIYIYIVSISQYTFQIDFFFFFFVILNFCLDCFFFYLMLDQKIKKG